MPAAASKDGQKQKINQANRVRTKIILDTAKVRSIYWWRAIHVSADLLSLTAGAFQPGPALDMMCTRLYCNDRMIASS